MPSFLLKALVSDHPLLFHDTVVTRAHSGKRPALVETTFLNSPGGRLRELRLLLVRSGNIKELGT